MSKSLNDNYMQINSKHIIKITEKIMKRKTYTTLAAIHLGSEVLRLRIVEYRSLNRIKVIEQCEYPIRLGEEAFKNKSIPFSMVEEI